MKRTLTLIAAALAPFTLIPAAGAAETTPDAAPDAPVTLRCDEGHWPKSVQGKPKTFKVGGAAGYYVWHDSSGWHLRTTTPRRDGHVFAGTITSSDDIKVLRIHKNESADVVKMEGETIRFAFTTHNHVDGIDFKVGCTESLTFELNVDGRQAPVRRIRLGATGAARTNPFTVSRVS